jgi:hypothetical protein
MSVPVDWKFKFSATAIHNGKTYTEADGILLLCKDRAVPATLRFYREECVRLGCQDNQLRAVDLLIGRVEAWQAEHPASLKVADIEGTEALVPPGIGDA